jgi:16S rRNA (cytidine1402-2'-O)-methyltransferase
VDHDSPVLTGTLFVVATPIGHLDDMTARAVTVLQQVDLIAAEDTRTSRPLLDRYGIMAPTLSLHQHNERKQALLLVEKLQAGLDIALISDAGTPAVSDPGARLVDEILRQGGKVVPIPGPSAVTALLSVAGLSCPRFCFYGFLSAKNGERQKELRALRHEPFALVFYEAPHRIQATLEALLQEWGGERRVVIGRELTKRFETVVRLTLAEAVQWVTADANHQRGEFVLALDPGSSPDVEALNDDQDRWLRALLQRLPVKEAVQVMVEAGGGARNALYERALQLRNENLPSP